jgi:hypothetical protein
MPGTINDSAPRPVPAASTGTLDFAAAMMTSEQRVLNDRYRLVYKLGAGGMGSVWLAEDLLLERSVAIKSLVLRNGTADLDERRNRVLQEARAMARVRHPAIVPIYDVFFIEDDPWIVMEYINGCSLEAIIRDRPLDEWVIAAIGLPVLRGLGAVHRANVVHRDVKPANILVAHDNSIFLVDFGIARIAGNMPLTDKRTVVGTPEFLAPERILGQEAGPAADLWSLGVTFFYALEGYSPFLRKSERSWETTMLAILHDDPPPLARKGRLAKIVPRMLRRDPAERADANELASVLQSIVARGTPPPPPAAPRPLPATPDPVGWSAPKPRGTVAAGPGRHARLKREDASEMIREVGTDTGVAMLLDMPAYHAAQLLADYPADVSGELLQGIAAAHAGTAGAIMLMLLAAGCKGAIGCLRADAIAAVLVTMPVGEAIRILDCADDATAADVITKLPIEVSLPLTKAMRGSRAADVLSHLRPATAASLLRADPDLGDALLPQLGPSFREQVIRHL